MNKENASKLWKMIQEAGDYLEGQLPNHPNHPKGRNPYAHVAICVKDHFDSTYKDIPDEKFRFNFSRKMGSDRLKKLKIKLPSKNKLPNWEFMESYIKSLPGSKNIEYN